MIEMYPSYLDGAPLATYRTRKRMTIEAWLLANMDTYADRDPAKTGRMVVLLNGEEVPSPEWPEVEFGPDDYVRIHPAARSGAGKALGGLLSGAFKVLDVMFLGTLSGLLGAMTPSMKTSSSRQSQGDRLSEATIKTNSAKINTPIRVAAGRNRIYPDIIMPPRRYFTAPTEQKIDLLLCFGWGDYDLTSADLLIGDTRAIALGEDFQSTIYSPGADLGADVRHEWWHQAPEVGASSKGSAGLELRATFDVDPDLRDVSELTFTDDVVFIPTGAGQYPEGWTNGAVVRIEQFRDYTVLDGMRIRGPLGQLAPFPGMQIEIIGESEGLYRVGTYTPYSPEVPADPGSASMATGSAAPATFDFAAAPVTFNVLFNNGIFPINLAADVSDMTGLLAALSAQLPAQIRAGQVGDAVRLTEHSPYSGAAITVSAGAGSVFGSLSYVAGTATTAAQPEVVAQMTLTFADGSPVTGLVSGTQRMAIGYAGLRYRIIAGGEYSIAVERLTDTGATDEDWPGFDFFTAVDAVLTLDDSSLEGDWCGWFAVCPEGEVVDAIEWDVFFPGGLIYINDKGRKRSLSVTCDLEWRELGSVAPGTRISKTYTQATQDQIGFTEREILPAPVRPEVRMRRIGAKSTSVGASNAVQWYGLKGRIPRAPTAYEGVTLAAVTIAGGDRLAAQVENRISGKTTLKLPLMDGGFGPTRDIAPWVRYVCHSVGYSDDDINMAELRRLHDIWSARGDYYDDMIEDNGTVKQVLNDALGAGFAELTVQRGLIHPVRDEPRSTFDDAFMFSAQNYLAGGGLVKTTEMFKHDDFDGVDVEYIDPDTNQWETVKCRLPGDLGLRVDKIRVQGVKDRTRAWRIGMRHRRALQYRRTQFSWSTEMDLFNCGYMSFVSLTDDVPGYGQSALVENVEYRDGKALLESTEPLHWEEGQSYLIGLRRPDGKLSGPYPATQVDEYTAQIDIPDFDVIPYSEAPDIEPTHLQFGPAQRWSYVALVQDVSPNGLTQATGTAVNYDERVYADDDNFVPA
ncbi:Putative phage tail protein [Halopseudomonas litoralis]|uniref:Putative phage tail protein n=1 Tax=Halopseudomonas litoralis TaxID=797277 RepID=A0A1H1NZB8_9GAMM|nr:host specificity factor TipJ family phage tail protein [Halopseudomonas litoralis]SDS04115.1 Putative phage tail protein [Halopseudomonas litoralis]